MTLDETHDPDLRSWVDSADGHPDFPVQNLPFGVFCPTSGPPRGGVAIGDMILDIGAAHRAGLFQGEAGRAAEAAAGSSLNAFFALGAGPRRALRQRLSALLAMEAPERKSVQGCIHAAASCTMELPARIGDYTDFYAGIHHATNGGKLFRPDNPLMPNYKYVPVAYHGRASSVRVSGHGVVRPNGQRLLPGESAPRFGPSIALDYEYELGIWIGSGNAQGEPIPIGRAADHIAGFCMLNDWSARDIQRWESQPLGPFLAKNFCTSVSPWVITPEALAPFRVAQEPRPEGDPAPLDYLLDPADQASGALGLDLEAFLMTPGLHAKGLPRMRLSRTTARMLYWTPAQMVAHHSCGGCNLQPGDLFGTGTISGTEPDSCGSLTEITMGGRATIRLSSGETRSYLEDGDEVIFTARAHAPGRVSIGFGECRGKVLPAP